MPSPRSPDFDAFISYNHADKTQARRIQRFLETATLPAHAGTPRRRLRVHRHDTDIRAAGPSAEIEAVLARCRALVVCCSPRAASAEWVGKEIDAFVAQDPTRPVIPVIVAGDPASALPPRLVAADYRYVDLSRGWVLGFLRPKARDELARVVAAVAGEDLRTFIPWDRRRRRRLVVAWAGALAVAVTASLFVPFERTRALDRPAGIDRSASIELCDVVDDRLVIAARENWGRGTEDPSWGSDVAVHLDAIGDPRSRPWLDHTDYVPAGRLLHMALRPGVRRLVEAFDRQALRQRALVLAAESHDMRGGEEGLARRGLEPGLWAAGPVPGLTVALIAVKPSKTDPDGDGGPPLGKAVVAVKDGDAPAHVDVVVGLYPPTLEGRRPPPPRSVALGEGLPVAATPTELFIGMPVRPDGGVGGLWRFSRAEHTWHRENVTGEPDAPHTSVYSIVTDPRSPGRVFVSTAPGDWATAARKGRYAAAVFERPAAGKPWRPAEVVPIESESAVQLCGFRRDGTLYVRVNEALFAKGTSSLLRALRPTDKPL
jgi:hypothetical protein